MFNLRRNIIYFIAFLGIFLFSSFSEPSPAYAFEQLDLDTLVNTYQCAACDLTLAELEETDLNGANLSGANLTGANVENALFGNNEGLTKSLKQDLIARGALFQD